MVSATWCRKARTPCGRSQSLCRIAPTSCGKNARLHRLVQSRNCNGHAQAPAIGGSNIFKQYGAVDAIEDPTHNGQAEPRSIARGSAATIKGLANAREIGLRN